ncbi:MAG: type I-E CRISPR-associated protein Cse1/CasA [Clostridiales bacterium]|nr:type I-E CRISPR-associated protein Cse1/CasA [Clostridiales bacterium]
MIVEEFNLLFEPWIAVRDIDGRREEVSLLTVFQNAAQYRSLAGELPAQDTAVLRLLLCVLHAALYGKDISGQPFSDDYEEQIDGAIQLWKDLWNKGLPYDRIATYLESYKDRFYLFHEETPFFQIPGLDQRDDVFGPFGIAKINGEIAEGENKARLFPQRAGEGKSSLSYAEAARWLLYYSGFAETFGKLEAKGKTSKSDPSIGVGWLGKLGLISAVGDNLFQTLMLNFVLLNDNGEVWEAGKPIWEKPVNTKERHIISFPSSQTELLSLQPRRVQLERMNGRVVSFRLVSGDVFPQEEAFAETMTIWRYGKHPGDKVERYRPRPFQPAVQLWRDFASLVSQGAGGKQGMPGIVRWTKSLVEKDIIPSDFHYRFQTSGISYGTMQAVITDVFSDSLAFNAGLLSVLHEGWITGIINGLSQTEKLVREVGMLAQNIVKAAGIKDGAGGKNEGIIARDEARTMAYYRLDLSFRLWLEQIDPATDNIDSKLDEWWATSQAAVRAIGRELMNQCSPQALLGRPGQSAAEAYNWFLYYTANRNALNVRGEKRRGKPTESNS